MGLLPPFLSFDSWRPSIVEDVTRVMFESRGDAFLRSSKLLTVLAQTNPRFYLGQESNQEIYQLVGAKNCAPGEAIIKTALNAAIRVAAARVVELGENPANVDLISVEGLKIPVPPLKEIDRLGAGALAEELSQVNVQMPECKLAPAEIVTTMAEEGETFYKNGAPNPWLTSFRRQQGSHAGH
jgi:hypothetical protein